MDKRTIDWKKVRQASKRIDELRKSGKFKITPSGTELIRKWRDSIRWK